MTKYAGRTAVVVGEATATGEATAIGLAIAKRLVEGGARVVLTAPSAADGRALEAELGSSARVVAASELTARLGPDGGVDLLFAGTAGTARPLLAHLRDGGAVVLTAAGQPSAAVHALAGEVVSRGIRVNAVAPGCIEAPGAAGVPLPPLGRLGAAEEVARAALFLATEATFTTGVRLPVDGGLGSP